MTKKIYKTAQGKPVDLGSLALQNENIRAVGNMNVNARGDRIDAQGKVIASRSQQVNKMLNKQTNTSSGPVPSNSREYKEALLEQEKEQRRIEEAKARRQAKRAEGQSDTSTSSEEPVIEGLAAAMARAQQIKDHE